MMNGAVWLVTAGLFVSSLNAQAQTLLQVGADIDGEAAGDRSGVASMSADGSRVAIGAYLNDGNGADSGHVRIYEYSGNNWTQLGQDIDGESEGDWMQGKSGKSVSLSADGCRVAIGAPDYEGNEIAGGQVRIFEYHLGSWIQLGTSIQGEAGGDRNGTAVALSADGLRVAIGAEHNSENGSWAGQMRVFEFSGGDWVQIGQNIYGNAEYDNCGYSVSLSAEGSRVAVGAPSNDDNGDNAGQVRVYEYSNDSWIQLGADILGEKSDDFSGKSVSLSADGSRVAIGAPSNDDNGHNAGQIRVFEYSESGWTQLGADINGEADDGSGRSVSLCSKGTRVAVGSPYNSANGNEAGMTRIYQYLDGSWIQLGASITGEFPDDTSGHSVSLSEDGSMVAIGAPQNDGNGDRAGHVRVFENLASLDMSIAGSGSAFPESGSYLPLTNLFFTATAGPGWLFVGWSGDLVGDYTTAETNITVYGAMEITATFSDDADGDGLLNTNEYALGTDPRNSDSDNDFLSDYEEVYTYPTSPTNPDMDGDGLRDGEEILTHKSDPNKFDTDSDGFGDGFEVDTGFSPISSNSTPDTYSSILTAVEFRFNAASGVTYQVESTADLSNSWETVESDISGQGGVVTRFYSTEGKPRRYFRARRE